MPYGSVEIVLDTHHLLGEGVVWSAQDAKVMGVDISGKCFWTFDPATGQSRTTRLAERMGCFAPLRGNRLIAGFASGLAMYDLETGARTRIAEIEADQPGTRLNDGKLDRQGRLIFGTMDETSPRSPIAQVWSYDGVSKPRVLFGGVLISNSIAFSPDGKRMYFADTPTRAIHVLDYDPATGDVANRRHFVTPDGGLPDGSAVDSEGCLWNAEWEGSRVVRYTPEGVVDRVIPLPASQITCCAFGCDDLKTLFITSARQGLNAVQLAEQPHAGAVFAVRTDVAGLPDTAFADQA